MARILTSLNQQVRRGSAMKTNSEAGMTQIKNHCAKAVVLAISETKC